MISEKECLDCGLCCRISEAQRPIAEKVGLKPGKDGFCTHFCKGSGCDIYSERPPICIEFERGGKTCLELRERNI